MDANLSCRCGATAWFQSDSDSSVKYEVRDWRADHLKCSELLITAGATPNVPTPEDTSVVESYKESGLDVTIPTTPPSLPSDQPGTPSGPAEPGSECAHQFVVMRSNMDFEICLKCRNVWKYDGKILVPAAAPTSSTSPSEASKPSVESSAGESATSASSSSTDICAWCKQSRGSHMKWLGHVFQEAGDTK